MGDGGVIHGVGAGGQRLITAQPGTPIYSQLSQPTGRWVQVTCDPDGVPQRVQIVPGALIAQVRETLTLAEEQRRWDEKREAMQDAGDGQDGHTPTQGGGEI